MEAASVYRPLASSAGAGPSAGAERTEREKRGRMARAYLNMLKRLRWFGGPWKVEEWTLVAESVDVAVMEFPEGFRLRALYLSLQEVGCSSVSPLHGDTDFFQCNILTPRTPLLGVLSIVISSHADILQ
jgi:hypothetical protein